VSDSLQQQLDQAMAEFEQRRQALIKARDEIAAVEVTVRSKDRAVEVTLGSDGGATGLRFLDNKHTTMSGQALASSVLEAMTLAREELNIRVRAGFDAVAGPGRIAGRPDRLDGLGLNQLLDPLRAPGGPLHTEGGPNRG
jgi:DNA-binding protein YbaB